MSDFEKCLKDIVEISQCAIKVIKKHDVLAIPDMLVIFKDIQDLMKEYKLALPEMKDIVHHPEMMRKVVEAIIEIAESI